jgi:hypothetical protein
MPSQACQSPEVELYYCRHPRDFSLPISSSMPTFTLPNGQIVHENPHLNTEREINELSQLEKTANWLRKSKTQQFDQLNGDTVRVTDHVLNHIFRQI